MSCIFCDRRATRPDEIEFNGIPELVHGGFWHRPIGNKSLGKSCQNKYLDTFIPGDRVIVFDGRIYKDDKVTPLSITMRPATVVCWYGLPAKFQNGYTHFARNEQTLIDVLFDHRPSEVSRGHFTSAIQAAVE
jgi:hypothetical protein